MTAVKEKYQPASRRPIAGVFRRTADWAVRVCVRMHVHPDAISYGSMAAAGGAAVCFWQSGRVAALLVPAVVLCIVRLWCNMLDGMVALASGKASKRGEILNDLPDRISDVVIFVGAAHSGLCHPLGGYWAAIAALLTAYVGTLGQAVGGRREYGGIMSKPWRMVWLGAGAWVTLGLVWAGVPIWFGGWSVMDVSFGVVIAGCVQTMGVRLVRIMWGLNGN